MGMNWQPGNRRHQSPDLSRLWPSSIEFFPTEVKLGERWLRVYCAVGFPRNVEPGWMLPLFRFSRPHTLRFYTRVLDSGESLGQMKRRLIIQRGSEAANVSLGRLSNPLISQAMEDTDRLRYEVARGDSKMADVSLIAAIWEDSRQALEASAQLLLGVADGMMLELRCLRYQQESGLLNLLPGGKWPEPVREMDTAAWATGFPFTGDEIMHQSGQIWGDHGMNPSWVIVDRFQMPSPHSVILGWSGSGKSYFAKLEALRSRYRGIQVAVIDPEGEYQVLRKAGARLVRIGIAGEELGFDPFSLDRSQSENFDGHVEFILRLLPRLVDGWSDRNQSRVLQVIYRDQESEAMSSSPRAWIDRLSEIDADTARLAATAMGRWHQVAGRPPLGVKAKQTISDAFVIYDLSHVSDRLKSAVYLALAEMLSRSIADGQRRLIIIDEAWYLVNDPDTVPYLETLFRRARKWGTAISLISQDFGDFTRSQSAEVCLRNSPLVLLLRQHSQSLNQLAEALHLSASEIEWLASAGTGQGLLLASDDHVPLNIWSTELEARVLGPQEQGDKQHD